MACLQERLHPALFNLNFKLHFIVRVVCVGVVLENQSNEFISFQLARLLPFIVIAFQLCFFLLFICFFHHRIPLYLVLKKTSWCYIKSGIERTWIFAIFSQYRNLDHHLSLRITMTMTRLVIYIPSITTISINIIVWILEDIMILFVEIRSERRAW